MSKICLIYQPCGIGDIFYSMGIARHYQKLGYKVIWPVIKELLYLNEYMIDIKFCSEEENFPKKEYYKQYSTEVIHNKDFIFLPLHRSSEITKDLIMPSKYTVANIPNSWKKNFIWNRNLEKENKLYYDVLNIKDDEDYIFINQNFITPPRTQKFHMSYESNGLREINMDYIEGYTVLDWYKVIENSSLIVTVDTCIQYMMEKMTKLKAKYYFCYVRYGIDTYNQIKDIFSIPWTYLTKDNKILNEFNLFQR